MTNLFRIALLGALFAACPAPPITKDGGTDAGHENSADGGAFDAGLPDGGSDGGPGLDAGLDDDSLMRRLPGLWVGPATMTPLGNFATMNVDFRAVGGRELFGRVDLDDGNALRFGFTHESVNGVRSLTYRNGGYFGGVLRDMRADLREVTPDSYRFCHVDRGCSYLDARYQFATGDETRFVLDVKVKGQPHLFWQAHRVETRDAGSPFPEGGVWAGSLSDPFPPMGSLDVTVSWATPLASASDVWLALSHTACGVTFACTPSRTLTTRAQVGATSVTLHLDQLHAGAYFANAVIDLNGNIRTLLRPDTGDRIAPLDTAVSVPGVGAASMALQALYPVP